jgi:hypothetical protein
MCLSCMGAELQAQSARPKISGTFLQLTTDHKNWTEEKWSELFGYFRRLQLSYVIVQWTVYDDTTFYGPASDAALEKVLARAAQSGMKVWIGLFHDSQYWNRIGDRPAVTARYLQQLRSRSLAAARDLAPRLKEHPGFAGWYLPEEIDDINWQRPEVRKELLRHLELESKELRVLAPDANVAISSFSNARLSPAQFQNFWSSVFRATSIGTVFLQDGVGVGKLELDELPLYAGALAQAARAEGRDFRMVVELFRQTSGQPFDSGPFKASPAALQRIRRQLEIAHQFTDLLVGFSVPEYMTPLGVAGAEQLYRDYLAVNLEQ